jgi:hypothetical protein
MVLFIGLIINLNSKEQLIFHYSNLFVSLIPDSNAAVILEQITYHKK